MKKLLPAYIDVTYIKVGYAQGRPEGANKKQ